VTEAQIAKKTLLGMIPVDSPFYGFHPVTRLALLIFLSVTPLFINMPEINLCLILLTVLLLRWGRVQMQQLRRYLPLLATVALFMFTVAYLAPGDRATLTEVRLGILTFYFQPMWWAFVSYCRLIAMLFGAILYFSTNRERDSLVALRCLRVPFAVSYVGALSLRSAGMFMEDFKTIREAEQARGLDLDSLSVGEKVKLYTMYTVPLVAVALRRAEEISNALFARGYTLSGRPAGGGTRTDYLRKRYPVRGRDWATAAGLIGVFVAVAVLSQTTGLFSDNASPLKQVASRTVGLQL
jgi:energy-coupling factor transporter transmembrane protein EcfT